MSLGIHRHDHMMRLWVPSQTRHGLEHLVDVTAYRCNGRCTCEHFTFRCEPMLRKGHLPSPLLRCNHIEQARDFLMEEMLRKIAPHIAPDADEEIKPPPSFLRKPPMPGYAEAR